MIELAVLREGVGGAQGVSDALLHEYERGAVAFLEEETRRHFGAVESITEQLDGSGDVWILLDNDPVADPDDSPNLNVVLEYADATGSWTAYDIADYRIYENTVVGLNSATFPSGTKNIRATYFAGFAAGSEPFDVRLAVISLAAYMLRNRIVVVPGDDEAVEETMPPDVVSTIKRWTVKKYEAQVHLKML